MSFPKAEDICQEALSLICEYKKVCNEYSVLYERVKSMKLYLNDQDVESERYYVI